ncbi:MAG: hypothetical protein ACI9OJ_003570 [Myxococcota bacterium]|jgi:hypothetical protein
MQQRGSAPDVDGVCYVLTMSNPMAATERFETLVQTHLGPAFEDAGWKRDVLTWFWPGKHGFALFEIQAVHHREPDHVGFCIRTGAWIPALAALQRREAHYSQLPQFTESEGYPASSEWNAPGMLPESFSHTTRWWRVDLEVKLKPLARRVLAVWRSLKPGPAYVSDLVWQAHRHEQWHMVERAAMCMLAMGDVIHARQLVRRNNLHDWAASMDLE